MNYYMNPQMPYGQQMFYGQQMPSTQMGAQTDWKDFCNRYMHHLVNVQTTDGMQYEGIIEGTDSDNMYMLVPDGDTRINEEEMDERFGPGVGYGFGGYGGFGGYWYPRRFRRFRRRRFPFFTIGGIYFPFFF